MLTPKQHQTLRVIYTLIHEDKISEATIIFNKMNLVDTPQHIALPKALRQLVHDLYEFLVTNNFTQIDKYILLKDIETCLKDNE